ncbi:MAG: 3-oxoacyl-ACP synthase III [Opitutales bacterium]
MNFKNVVIESLEYAMPEEVWTSADIEAKLRPTYERLKLPEGRLELMTGIKERRFWPLDKRPSEASALAGKAVLEKSNVAAQDVDLLIHSAVCRDRLEPATASYVHRLLDLPGKTQILDVSNACLGFLNAILLAAGLIESGQIKHALIVSGENGRPLMENTLRALLDPKQTRKSVKPYFANLTIGAGAVGAMLSHKNAVSSAKFRVLGGIVETDTSANELCEGDSSDGNELAMQTDSEALLVAGVALAKRGFERFLDVMSWSREAIEHVITHQVGSTHRNRLFETIGLDVAKDFSTFERFGNVGSVSCPLTLACAEEAGQFKPGDSCALLGIGSGLSTCMMGVERL